MYTVVVHCDISHLECDHRFSTLLCTNHWKLSTTPAESTWKTIYTNLVSSQEWPWRHWAHLEGYTLQDASFIHQSQCPLLKAWENTHIARATTSDFVRNTRWRHGRSWGETKYNQEGWGFNGFNLESAGNIQVPVRNQKVSSSSSGISLKDKIHYQRLASIDWWMVWKSISGSTMST